MTIDNEDDYWDHKAKRQLIAERLSLIASIMNWTRTSLVMVFVGWMVVKILAHYGVL